MDIRNHGVGNSNGSGIKKSELATLVDIANDIESNSSELKTELASVTGSDADTVVGQVLAIKDAKSTLAEKTGVDSGLPLQAMVEGLSMGKKWASGSYESSQRTMIVDNLGFKPSLIIVIREIGSLYGSTPYANYCIYHEATSSTKYVRNDNTIGTLDGTTNYVRYGGFSLANGNGASAWLAFE